MKIILSHPTGNANVRGAAEGFGRAGMLAEFHTTVASFPGSPLDQLGGIGQLSDIRRRRFDASLKPFTHTWPWLEMGRLLANKVGLLGLTSQQAGLFSVDAVYEGLDRRVAARLGGAARRGANAVYAYDGGAANSFVAAGELNMRRIYDLPTGHWRAARRLLDAERARRPEWAATMTGFHDSDQKLARKDEELRLADCIFVASQFTARTLAEYPGQLAPIKVIPYGFPPVATGREYRSPADAKRLKLLFVGNLSQQKGLATLLEAVDKLARHVELTLVGSKPTDQCPALNQALARHRWVPSVSHPEVLRLMRGHDVLLFPSLFDGFGLVMTEAMSQGTPVIASERCAGPDIIRNGENGWLVEAGSSDAILEALEGVLQRPETVAEVGRAAMETARHRSWQTYGQELCAAITSNQTVVR